MLNSLRWTPILLLVLPVTFLQAGQDPRQFNPDELIVGTNQVEIDKAIKKGIEFLKGVGKTPGHAHSGAKHSDELLLWTFLHGDVPMEDAKFQKMLQRVLSDPLETTYKVTLQAMTLEELDRAKYQGRIAQCAQFLVDNQCKNGQWSYGDPSPHVNEISTDTATSVVTRPAPGSGPRIYETSPGHRTKPPVTRKIPVKKKKEGPAQGDNSNTQYASLGLRACHDAGILIPRDVVELASHWWRVSQHAGIKDSGYGGVRGWNYKTEDTDKDDRPAYESMTAGAVGCLVIYDYMLGKDWSRDPSVRDGLNWLASNFSVNENAGRPKPSDWYYYCMYAIERAGILYGTAKFGKHLWYKEGAEVLLKRQKPDGSWEGHSDKVWNTCFAILFLKRATRPLIATGPDR